VSPPVGGATAGGGAAAAAWHPTVWPTGAPRAAAPLVQYIAGVHEPDPTVARQKTPIEFLKCDVAIVVRRGREEQDKIDEPISVSAEPMGCEYSGSFWVCVSWLLVPP